MAFFIQLNLMWLFFFFTFNLKVFYGIFFRPNEIIMLFYSIICLFYLILFYSTYHYISKQIIHALLLKMLSYKPYMTNVV